mmetsp:Transcript_37686/g.60449  ORF Transcript_37686/g.60449 Transcript_37686/m.60449 type:complete len:244 (-) Transcript_37686:335-1066(-)
MDTSPITGYMERGLTRTQWIARTPHAHVISIRVHFGCAPWLMVVGGGARGMRLPIVIERENARLSGALSSVSSATRVANCRLFSTRGIAMTPHTADIFPIRIHFCCTPFPLPAIHGARIVCLARWQVGKWEDTYMSSALPFSTDGRTWSRFLRCRRSACARCGCGRRACRRGDCRCGCSCSGGGRCGSGCRSGGRRSSARCSGCGRRGGSCSGCDRRSRCGSGGRSGCGGGGCGGCGGGGRGG